MTTDGGGWTKVFGTTDYNLNLTDLDYTLSDSIILDSAMEMLAAHRDDSEAPLEGAVIIAMLDAWRTQSPFSYYQGTEETSARLVGGDNQTVTMWFGYSEWHDMCGKKPWDDNGNRGQFCVEGLNAAVYNNFARDMADSCVLSSSEDTYSPPCSPSRHFTLYVR